MLATLSARWSQVRVFSSRGWSRNAGVGGRELLGIVEQLVSLLAWSFSQPDPKARSYELSEFPEDMGYDSGAFEQ